MDSWKYTIDYTYINDRCYDSECILYPRTGKLRKVQKKHRPFLREILISTLSKCSFCFLYFFNIYGFRFIYYVQPYMHILLSDWSVNEIKIHIFYG